jgi:glycosyltransferase involved in cell wall biosynthesis
MPEKPAMGEKPVMSEQITFAIPFYSGIRYLAKALDSVIAQSNANWRAIVVDDGAEPGVEALVLGYGDVRLRYYKNERNLGMAGNWNRCLDLPDTDLVNVLHQDDELLPNYASVMLGAAARHPEATAFYAHTDIISETGEAAFSFPDFVKTKFIDPSPNAEVIIAGESGLRALLKGDFIMCPTLCYRRSRLASLRFDDTYKMVLDIELTTQILLRDGAIVGCPDICYRYRRHAENATSEHTRSLLRFREESAYFDRVYLIAKARGWQGCATAARRKSILKLNLGYVTLSSLLRRQWGPGARGLRMLTKLLSGHPIAPA